MAQIYFGGADGRSPITPPSTVDWNTVNPPEVQAEAWKFEMARREAERQREIEAQLMGPEQDRAASAKAIEAAIRFQGIRGFQSDLASGKSPQEALARNAPMMFVSKPGALPQAMPQQNKVQSIGGVGYVMQPDGTMKAVTPAKEVKPPVDLIEQDLRKRVATAQTEVDKAVMELDAMSATRPEVTAAKAPGAIRRFFGAETTPAVTNQVPVFDQTKQDEARAKADAATKRLQSGQMTLDNYLSSRGKASPAAQAASKALTRELATDFLMQAKGDRNLARKLAREAGYIF